MPLGTLGVVGGCLVLPGVQMDRRLLMMRCGRFATFRRFCVLFLDFLCHGICFIVDRSGGFLPPSETRVSLIF